MSDLPIWLQWVKVLAVPIFTAVIALVGGWVGYQQMQIAQVKLQHDLYERRFKVYDAARTFLLRIFTMRDASQEEIQTFNTTTAEADFLFDLNVYSFLQDVGMQALALHTLEEARKNEPYQRLIQALNALPHQFRPFLAL